MELQAEKMLMYLLYISLLWSMCELSGDTSQPASFQAVKLGDTITIRCHFDHYVSARVIVWYQLTTGRRLQLVASTDTLYNLTTYGEKSHHCSVNSDRMGSHLVISTTTSEDTGTYYCGRMDLKGVQFQQGTFLMIKGEKMVSDSVVQKPQSQSVQSGDSLTLKCSVHPGQCTADHMSIMWLKNSDHSLPELMYSSGNKSSACQNTKSGETTCVYDLPMRNISSDDAGVYYCVVTSCGQVLFGNGTWIHIHREDPKPLDLSPTVVALMLSNIILGVVTLLLAWTLCKNCKKEPMTSSRSTDQSPEVDQTRDAVVYAAVCSASRISSGRSASVKQNRDTIIYSDVRFRQQD
ncbi:signal-regulatory protein beta-2-like [Mugil cephalus]|uniref:signal-regulatory protein beta-2-like n=1 Tax=Mugil cephalus TaxID=48193 RepID=UPI001FB5DF4D|nr:signal-regulatory protein beta-2-like [Mugil cephalus]